MPELPDVETFKRYLEATSLHQEIERVSHVDERALANLSPTTLRRHLVGSELASARRHGKYLFAELSRGGWLVLHFGMTGFLRYFQGESAPEPVEHERMRLDFQGGYHLAYDCQRLFGSVTTAKDADAFIEQKELGPDALAVGADDFARIVRGKRSALKSVLMDQKRLAGLGNVYSDEILYQARLDPSLPTAELDERELAGLYEAMKGVLQRAIEVQADPARMPKDWITPRRGRDERCPGCRGPLERRKIGQRSAYLCPRCQRG